MDLSNLNYKNKDSIELQQQRVYKDLYGNENNVR